MRSFLLLITAIICMSTSCEKNGQRNCNGAICTEILTMVTLQVTNAGGSPAILDDHYTLRVSTGEKIRTEQSMGNGYFVVLDDSYQKKLQDQQDEFKFIGIRDGKEVINESYAISADCCHIERKSGKTEIILQ
jgi:hypothetical protein